MANLLPSSYWFLVKTSLFLSFLSPQSLISFWPAFLLKNFLWLPVAHWLRASLHNLAIRVPVIMVHPLILPVCLLYLVSHQSSEFKSSASQLAPQPILQHPGGWHPSYTPSLECLPSSLSTKMLSKLSSSRKPSRFPPTTHRSFPHFAFPQHLMQRQRVKI